MVFTSFEINNKISNVRSEEFPLKLDINYNNNIQLNTPTTLSAFITRFWITGQTTNNCMLTD